VVLKPFAVSKRLNFCPLSVLSESVSNIHHTYQKYYKYDITATASQFLIVFFYAGFSLGDIVEFVVELLLIFITEHLHSRTVFKKKLFLQYFITYVV